MRRLAGLAVAAAVLGCASPTGVNGGASAPPAGATAPAPAPGDATILATASQGAVATALAPPAEAGASRSSVSGCLTAVGESDATRFPAPPVSRNPAPPVTVTAVPGGALVVHELTHACCLRAQVTTSIAGSRAVVRETLTGNPCRCMCGSTLRTAVGLPPGAWTVVVELEIGGQVRPVAEIPVAVR
jgi:hypothetical protein